MSAIEVYADAHAPEWALELGGAIYAAYRLTRIFAGTVLDITRALR